MATVTIEDKLLGIETSRNTIRAKLVELGLAESSAHLDALATIIAQIVNQGAISVTVQEGDTYTIPAGYHNGSGTVSGVAGGGNYNLQAKTATPTKSQQNIVPDSGYYGLSGVTVAAIPSIYQDVSSVTAGAEDVLTGKIIVLANGTVKAGTMTDNGAVAKVLDATTVTYTIPKGYHNGSGKVTITLEEKSVTPTKSAQTVTPTAGKVLSKVTVDPIPEEYITTDDANATEADMLDGATGYVNGVKVAGNVPRNGAINESLNGITKTSVEIPAGHTTGGNVTFDDTKIAEMLDAI